jgi:hypothetical protein
MRMLQVIFADSVTPTLREDALKELGDKLNCAFGADGNGGFVSGTQVEPQDLMGTLADLGTLPGSMRITQNQDAITLHLSGIYTRTLRIVFDASTNPQARTCLLNSLSRDFGCEWHEDGPAMVADTTAGKNQLLSRMAGYPGIAALGAVGIKSFSDLLCIRFGD